MKILDALQIKEADRFTIEHEPVSSIDLMERAGERLADALLNQFPSFNSFAVFCGYGNNGGDGLVMARLLKQQHKTVVVFLLKGNYSPECLQNIERLNTIDAHVVEIASESDLQSIIFNSNDCIVDALFGIGLSRPLHGLACAVVQKINTSENTVIAIDLPSGLSPDAIFESDENNTVRADETFSIQLPKLSFMLPENARFTGRFQCIDIGLSQKFIDDEKGIIYLDENEIKKIIKPRPEFGHKGTFGHALIIAGSEGKCGASILSAKAALRTGCGLLTAMIPAMAVTAMHCALPEAMVISPQNADDIEIQKYNAIGFGPGMGTSDNATRILKALIDNKDIKLLIDADGLNILSVNKDWLGLLHSKVILTPHPGEFDRLTQPHESGAERFRTQKAMSEKYGITIVLKGHHTSITTPEGMCFFNSTGNSGMATAGSGDVLTGIITSLCAQGYTSSNAATLGVYLHGYAGDSSAFEISETALIASDIIDGIGIFF